MKTLAKNVQDPIIIIALLAMIVIQLCKMGFVFVIMDTTMTQLKKNV